MFYFVLFFLLVLFWANPCHRGYFYVVKLIAQTLQLVEKEIRLALTLHLLKKFIINDQT